MALFQDSQQTIQRRNEEATKIFKMLLMDWENVMLKASKRDGEFLASLHTIFNYKRSLTVSVEELFRLRDLVEKYL